MKGSCLRPIAAVVFVSVLVAVAAGCGGVRRPPKGTGPGVINMVYLETVGGHRYVRVYDRATLDSTNRVHAGQKITWINTNDWDFCVMFSRDDNPFGGPGWKPLHKAHGPVFILAPSVPPKADLKVFKYSIIAFESVPTSTPPTTPGAVTNTVAVTAEDPFIIIQN